MVFGELMYLYVMLGRKDMKNLKISLIQADLIWENPVANLDMLDEMIGKVPAETDLVLLPETFATGFTMRSEEYAENENGRSVTWMKKMAVEHSVHITGSLIIRDEAGIRNRLLWVSPEGIAGTYDKRHLFRMGREDKHFFPGSSRRIFRLGDFNFMPQICYDLRFPVFSRNRGDYDVLFYVANWPESRHTVWETLLRARAIENQSYVIGVNRSGKDGEGMDHNGGSCIIDPMGRVMASLNHSAGILNGILDYQKIKEFREKFQAWKDADHFTLSDS
jgi:omega-amidase